MANLITQLAICLIYPARYVDAFPVPPIPFEDHPNGNAHQSGFSPSITYVLKVHMYIGSVLQSTHGSLVQ